MKMRQLVLVVLTLIVVKGLQETAHAQAPKLSPRRAGVPTVWVASEVLLCRQNLDFSVSIPVDWVVVDSKIQEAEGDEIIYHDPTLRDWVTCDKGNGVCKRPDGVSAPILFVWMGPVNGFTSTTRDKSYVTYSVQVRNGSPVRFRARYALQIQPAATPNVKEKE